MHRVFRFLLFSLIVFFYLSSTTLTNAAPSPETTDPVKKKLLYICVFKKDEFQSKVVDETQPKKHGILIAPFKERLSKENYLVIDDSTYFERMKKAGFPDIASIEKGDIIDIFKDGQFDYIMLLELAPYDTLSETPYRNSFGTYDTAKIGKKESAHFKLIKVAESRYLYNGKINKNTIWGSEFAVTRKIAEEVDLIVDEKVLGKPSAPKHQK
jgi:hypothetical protein